LVSDYEKSHAEKAGEWRSMMNGELPADWEDHLPKFEDAQPMATRVASGEVIKALAPVMTSAHWWLSRSRRLKQYRHQEQS
jgi:transketolase